MIQGYKADIKIAKKHYHRRTKNEFLQEKQQCCKREHYQISLSSMKLKNISDKHQKKFEKNVFNCSSTCNSLHGQQTPQP